ncbi:MAG: S8 family peptidase [Oceanicaulis sp.]
MGAAFAYSQGATGAGVTVAVVDTGIVLDHPEFEGRLAAGVDVAGDRGVNDTGDGHGTGVAGVIAANKDDFAMHGVAFESTILPIRADSPGTCEADGGDSCSFADVNVARAIDEAVARGARVINLSLGRDAELGDDSTLTFRAMRRAAEAGVFLVVAAGNKDDDEDEPDPNPGFPANFVNDLDAGGFAVAVGAVDQSKVIASFSNRAEGAENFFLVAPGVRIVSPGEDDEDGDPQYFSWNGTSFAAPHVAGALALLIQAFPNLTGNEALSILFDTAEDLGEPGPDSIYGVGLVDLEAAFNPVGSSSIQMGGSKGEAVTVAALTAAPSGAAGDWLWTSGLLDGAVMRDGYRRPFAVNPEAPRAAVSSGLAAMEAAAEGALSRTSRTLAGPAEINLRYSEPQLHALKNLPAETYGDTPDMRFAFTSGGLSLAAGRGFAADAPVDGAGAGALSPALFSGAVAGLSNRRDWASLSYRFGDVSVGFRAAGAGGDAFSAASAVYHAGAHSFGVETGAGREAERTLGGLFAARFEAEDQANSSFAAALWSGPLPAGWRGAARFEHARTDIALPGFVALERGVEASAWSLGAERALAGGVFGLTLSQPLRVERGAISVRVPVSVDGEDRLGYEIRNAALSPSGRELALEAGWRVALNERTAANIAARFTREPGHVAGAKDEGLIWMGLRTTW